MEQRTIAPNQWKMFNKTLLQVQSKVPDNTQESLCKLIDDSLMWGSHVHTMTVQLFKAWPEFSGDQVFPISVMKNKTPAAQYYACKNKWNPKSKTGQARRRLLQWMIDESARRSQPGI